MLKNSRTKICNILLSPFREHLLFLIVFFVLATSIYFIRFIEYGNYYYSVHVLCHCLLISYIITLILSLIRNNLLRKTLQSIIILLSAFLFAANTYCFFEIGTLLDADYTMLALDTNASEAKEFLSSLVPLRFVINLIAIFVLFIILWAISKKHPIRFGHKWSFVAMGLLSICAIKNVPGWGWEIWKDGPIGKLTDLYTSLRDYDLPDEDQRNIELPTITFEDNQQMPENVVLIIGESFARYHSSLYGYEKETNPCLSELKASSLLYALDSIDSPAATTALSLKFTLSIFDKNSQSEEKKWYEYPSIIEIMKASGFDCYWFSNQPQNGQNNNIGRFYSIKCDQHWFLSHEDPTNDYKALDKVLVDTSFSFIETLDKKSPHFFIYHMSGSHFEYEKRYPKEYAKFNESDYISFPENQRSWLSSYDNSILYNDYVVEQILNLYKDTESIIVYLPDHGQDVFKSSPSHCAHGKINDPVSYAFGVQIPFMIYASPLYQQKHPETMQRIKYRQDHPKAWNSDDLPYLIMDLIGVKEVNGEDVKLKSVLD